MVLRFTSRLNYEFKSSNMRSCSENNSNSSSSFVKEYVVRIRERIKKYQIIASNQSKSRFSILIKRKGGVADLLIREELKSVPLYLDYQRDKMAKLIHKNAQYGFRSLLFSKYRLSPEETLRFTSQLDNLQTNIVKERQAHEKLFAFYEAKESSMQFIALLGIREKLRVTAALVDGGTTCHQFSSLTLLIAGRRGSVPIIAASEQDKSMDVNRRFIHACNSISISI